MTDENFCTEEGHEDYVKEYCQLCYSKKLREGKKSAYKRGQKNIIMVVEKFFEGADILKGGLYTTRYVIHKNDWEDLKKKVIL